MTAQQIPRSPSAAALARLPPSYSVKDPNTLSDPHVAVITHVHLDLTADFDAKTLRGHVEHTIAIVQEGVRELVLDTSLLTIEAVEITHPGPRRATAFSVDPKHALFGSALRIALPPSLKEDAEVRVRIAYATAPESTALQWLTPAMTVGKKHPYLFSQCQAIHARALLPCQDTPMVKHTYSASLEAPAGLVAVMSALRKASDSPTRFNFSQPVPIPSYLIALAVGNLTEREVGPRSSVFAEPEVVDAAAKELGPETDRFLRTAEEYLLPYCWGRYDLLVLPPSFPYGGMENPCLTFVTPTLLAGDGSLADVVAHEIAHSWTGNLVTNATWEAFWLNEGFTMFVERKIIARLHGEPMRHLSAIVGWKHLQEDVAHFGPTNRLTALCPVLTDTDPDDAFSGIPYEKGFNLLFELEHLLGGAAVFDNYVRAHVAQFSGKSITVDDWRMFLYTWVEENLGPDGVQVLKTKIDWDAWLFQPGLPPKTAPFDTSLQRVCVELADRWSRARGDPAAGGFAPNDLEPLTPLQKMVFLERVLEANLPAPAIEQLGAVYGLASVRNAEIRFRWLTLCLTARVEACFPDTVAFVSEQGRMKYVRPVYRLLAKAGPSGRQLALETFSAHRDFYHPIAASMIAKDLGV